MNHGHKKIKSVLMTAGKALVLCTMFALISEVAYARQVTASVFNRSSNEQERNVSVAFENEPLGDALHTLARKVKVGISYNTKAMPNKLVTYQAKNASVYKVLDAILLGTGLQAKLSKDRKVIFIKQKPVMPTVQQETITGTVTDASNGQTLPGVNILVKGTTTGTSTDANGAFELTVESLQDTLVVTFIGYQRQEVPINGRSTVDITMQTQTISGEELVVVGYGVQDRKTLTSSVSSVSADEIENEPTAGPDQLIQGRAAGVQVSSTSGTPGSGTFIRIRGTTSISGDSEPLYVVDGVPIQTGSYGLGAGGGTTSAMADIDPSNIESIEVLKDASATAIYGARASNGVVLITTKRGSDSTPTIRFSTYYGGNTPLKVTDMVSGPQFEMLMNEAAQNNGEEKPYENPQGAIDTDWGDTVFRNGSIHNYDLGVSGGNETIKYSVSGSNYRQEGIVAPTDYNRSSFNANIDVAVSDKLNVGTSIKYSFSVRDRANMDDSITSVVDGVISFPTNIPIYQPDGSYTKFSIYENPVVASKEVDWTMDTDRLIGNIFGEYEFLSGLSFKTSWSYDLSDIQEDRYYNTFTNQGSSVNGSATARSTTVRNWIGENTLSYSTNTEHHNFDALLGASVQESDFAYSSASGEQFPSDDFRRIADAAVQSSYSTGSRWGIASFFGRIQYDFDSKYLATLTVRRDGSSRFGKNNRWGTFPSVAIGWLPSEESFFKVGWVNSLKLRASYGITGNQSGINNFQSLGLWEGSSYVNFAGTSPEQLANPDLKWETTSQLDIGVDLAVLDERLTFTYDYYYKKTKDLLLAVPVPRTTGFNELVQNFGEVENKGMELGISADIIRQKDINWNLQFNISGNRNKILKLAAPFNVYNRDLYRYKEGYPMYSFYLHNQLGVDPDTGKLIFEDVDGDGAFNPNSDRRIVGDANPDLFGGIRSTLNYRHFDVAIFFNYNYGNKVLNWTRYFNEHGGTRVTGLLSSQLDRWQEPGDHTMIPKMNSANYAANLRPSRFLEDGSYLRMKSVTIGYSLPSELLNRIGIGISSLRFYMRGKNLLTFTNYSGLDPELTATASTKLTRGIEFFSMPQAKAVLGGFDIKF